MRAHQELPESKNGLDQFVDQLVSGVLEEGEQDWIAPLRN